MLVVVVIAIVALVGYSLFIKNGNLLTRQVNQNFPAIQNGSDLDKTANDLDNTSTGQIDTELNQLNSDASTF